MASSKHDHNVSSLQQLEGTGILDMTALQNSANARTKFSKELTQTQQTPTKWISTHTIKTSFFPYDLFNEVPVNQSIRI
jgi:hypothetical protein